MSMVPHSLLHCFRPTASLTFKGIYEEMNIAVLKTGLFPDTKTLDEGIEHLLPSYFVYIYDATRDDLTNADWDQALDEILAADRFIVL